MATRNALEMLRTFWEREPIVVLSIGIGCLGPILAYLSPLRKQQELENANFPRRYPFETLTYMKPEAKEE